MQGLVNRAIEGFARCTYGDEFWQSVLRRAGFGTGWDAGVEPGRGQPPEKEGVAPSFGAPSFGALLDHDPHATEQVITALAATLGKSTEEVLEDIGTFLVAAARMQPVRRLLRFGGADFVEFLFSLSELPARTRLALPELDMPQIVLRHDSGDKFNLCVRASERSQIRYGHVLLGLLRAMADDYGALVFLEYLGREGREEFIEVTLLETGFATARDFSLAGQTV